MHAVFRGTTTLYRAHYLLCRQQQLDSSTSGTKFDFDFESILCYPLCSEGVLLHLSRLLPRYLDMPNARQPPGPSVVRLPRRLFRSLVPPRDPTELWTESAQPLPFIKTLFSLSLPNAGAGLPRVDVNAHDGYALTKAVHAHHLPLVRFLLAHGADPGAKSGLAVMVAIRAGDLGLVRTLVERVDDARKSTGKRRRLRDRVVVSSEMLRMAVRCDARDIVQYFREEKGLVPDLKTLRTLPAMSFVSD